MINEIFIHPKNFLEAKEYYESIEESKNKEKDLIKKRLTKPNKYLRAITPKYKNEKN